jgi:response regulator of citrate/malate metabolism
MKKLQSSVNRKNWKIERRYSEGSLDVLLEVKDATAEISKKYAGVDSKTADKLQHLFDHALTAREVSLKLKALRM